MAEIRIERKRRGLGWLWLLLALIICAALAWYFLSSGRSTTPAATPATTGAVNGGAAARLALAEEAWARVVVARPNYSGGPHGQG